MSVTVPASDRRFPGAVAPGRLKVESFNPLLRSLLSFELVHRVADDDGSATWVLTEEAQRRLDELAPGQQLPAASLAYLDHPCARCHTQRLTHLIEGRYLCEPCAAAPAPTERSEAQAARGGRRSHRS